MLEPIKEVSCLFDQPWWLDAVAPNAWQVITHSVNGDLKARMPVYLKKRRGFTALTMPPLTQTLGVWLKPSEAKYSKQLSQQKEYISALLEQIPPFDLFSQQFHYSLTNVLPFHWKGFSSAVQYSYVLDDLSDLDKLWANFTESTRREIRKATKTVEVQTELSLDTFIDLNRMTFERQRQSLPYSEDLIKRLDEACINHNARKIFFAVDAGNQVHAALYIVWDERSAYYLMGGGNPSLRSSGATSLLMWEAIKFAATITRKFDFEGSMIEPIERFFRGFGAKQTAFYEMRKMSKRMRLLHHGNEFFKAVIFG